MLHYIIYMYVFVKIKCFNFLYLRTGLTVWSTVWLKKRGEGAVVRYVTSITGRKLRICYSEGT